VSDVRAWVATAAAAALLLAGAGAAASTTTTAPNTPDVQGTLRCVGGVYSPLNDAGHASHNIGSVVTGSDRITIYYTTPMTKVGSMQVTTDETYTINGYAAGASVGLDKAVIFLARNGVKVSPASACIASSNIWLTGWEG
jgi:hypothetical protein